jgi:hypothetical protein
MIWAALQYEGRIGAQGLARKMVSIQKSYTLGRRKSQAQFRLDHIKEIFLYAMHVKTK